jgi:DnaJ-like protein
VSDGRGLEALPTFDPYVELRIRPGADNATIEAAYRGLMKRHHPDVAADPIAGEERGKRLNVARRWLTDPDLRRRYDAVHGHDRPRLSSDWEPPPTTADDLLRVRYDRRSTPPARPPYGALLAVGLMILLGAVTAGFGSGLTIVAGAAGLTLMVLGGLALLAGPSFRPAIAAARPGRRGASFAALLVVGLVFLGFGSLLISLSVWLIPFSLPALVAGTALTLYGGIGAAIGLALGVWSRVRSSDERSG